MYENRYIEETKIYTYMIQMLLRSCNNSCITIDKMLIRHITKNMVYVNEVLLRNLMEPLSTIQI